MKVVLVFMNQFDGNVGGTVTLAAEQEQISVVPSHHHLHDQSCLLSSQERLQASNTNNGATGAIF